MDKIDRLVNLLKRLNSEEITESLKSEALKMVSSVDPLELSLAEQKLIEDGTKPEDLRHLCDIHMEVLKSELDKLKLKLSPNHVLTTLIEEHDEILKLLSLLEELNAKIQTISKYDKNIIEFNNLLKTIDSIIDAENHHKREEDVLFPELESRGVTGPTRIMRMEHDMLRNKKHEIRNLIFKIEAMDFNQFKTSLDEAVKYLVFNLRDHIYKENHILYPSSIETLTDSTLWNQMKEECDKIGYCSFTPGK
ncbi:DUF438 domain-containing protein [Clostridium sp. PL3]|uniref:DUF438 domain-containing protein n=1 Tax=Clostridium thailandense TaxID=2794346 RepID=A0A949WWK9_9CLOT|nr:DUF438 domain-containing protein [Clostridium thailandense]MBV7274942.1 DUF438 domain-containing protein [Clostridium thailandense]